MSNEIFLKLKKSCIWRQIFRKLICSFQTEKLNQLIQSYNVSSFVLICLIMFFLKKSKQQ